MDKSFLKSVLSWVTVVMLLSGCLSSKPYVNSSGDVCRKKIKFFLIFFTWDTDCEPAQSSGQAPASGPGGANNT